MCLLELHDKEQYAKGGYGYKVFRKHKGTGELRNLFEFIGDCSTYEIGKKYVDKKTGKLNLWNERQEYPTGYHILANKDYALSIAKWSNERYRDNYNYVVIKVSYRSLMAVGVDGSDGENHYDVDADTTVIVARTMTLIEEV